MKTPIVAMGVALLLATQAVQADKIYRWVDADGGVHYGSTPPPGQAVPPSDLKYQRNPDPEAAQLQLQKYKETSDQRRKESELAAKAGAEQEKEAAQRAERCSNARAIIDRLHGDPGIRYKREDGSYAPYDDAEREQKLTDAQAAVDESCD